MLSDLKGAHNSGDNTMNPKNSKIVSEKADVQEELKAERAARLKAEKEIERLNQELDRQKRAFENLNQELESFSYSISHDLRAPLRHLVGFSSALLEDFAEGLEPTAHSYLDCIARAGRKLEGLIEALLSLSRIGRQEMNLLDLDLGQMARALADSLKHSDPERRVEFKIADHLPARGDAVLMRTALEQMLANAWKFTGNKGSATIEVGAKQEGEGTVFYVRDDGAGFDMRFADRLFGPFQRMHREDEFPGLGVGLATVQRIIHRHGGKIWAEAEPDLGATFFFTLSP